MAHSSPRRVDRKHCGKRRNYLLGVIPPCPIVFSKDLYSRHVKTRACLERGKQLTNSEVYILRDDKPISTCQRFWTTMTQIIMPTKLLQYLNVFNENSQTSATKLQNKSSNNKNQPFVHLGHRHHPVTVRHCRS